MHWSMRVEGAEARKRVQMTVDTVETVLQEMTLGNQLNFMPEYMKYIGLESCGQILIFSKVPHSYHKTLYVTAGSNSKALSVSLSYHKCSRGKASSKKLSQGSC